ncbi:MAG: NAD(+)/NADH kinase [Thermoplasmatota archaeon]
MNPGEQRDLHWGLVCKAAIPHVRKEAFRLRDHLEAAGQKVSMEDNLARFDHADGEEPTTQGRTVEEMHHDVDLFITVGGDGTILYVQQRSDKPVFAVNAGAIGFLTEVEPAQATAGIDRVLAGDYKIDERRKLAARLGDRALPDAANEVTLQTSRIAKLIQFRIKVDGELMDTLRGDGVILSTATGSTGYAMSVGGPLVHPRLKGVVVAPIAPFRLAARPWVIPDDSTIEVTLLERDSSDLAKPAKVVVDGQHGFEVATGETVTINTSDQAARFVRLGSSFYERVRNKLTR